MEITKVDLVVLCGSQIYFFDEPENKLRYFRHGNGYISSIQWYLHPGWIVTL
ncbi:hypothetical protein J2T13_000305 [Paenibacillus sp. DS2015]|uniref:hypothetical protein n=1 Tax=Paenibacillus sp. DS2015 TaxID=3373917 RepID=UPI003D1FB521